MDTNHTPEPWQINQTVEDTNGCLIESTAGRMICECFEDGEPHTEEDQANAHRIIACVNACKGISTEYLEHFGGTSFNDFKRVKDRRDELAETLKSLDERLRECSKHPITASEAYDSFYQDMVSTALGKVPA